MLPPQTGPKFVHTEQNQIQKRPKNLFSFKIHKGQWPFVKCWKKCCLKFDAKISFANLKVLQVLVFKSSLKSWQIEKGMVH